MPKQVLKLFVAGLITTIFAAGCSKGPTGPAGPALNGALTGLVTLVNSDGSQPSNRDSVTVSIEGTSMSTQTDASGMWLIDNVKTGTYTISFSKSGYGITKSVQYQFAGGGEKNLGLVYLCQSPTFSISNLTRLGNSNARTDSTSIYFGITTSTSTVVGPYRTYLVLSPDSGISSIPALSSYAAFFTTNIANGMDSADIRLTPSIVAAGGFNPGDTVYAAAYAANAGSNNSGYLDTSTGKTVYTNLCSIRSNVVKFVIPAFSQASISSALTGFVVLVDANGGQPSNRDSVSVSLVGTNLSTLTDSTGKWTLTGAKAGTYTISYSRTGFGITKTVDYQLGSGVQKNLGIAYICQPPAFSVDSIVLLGYSTPANRSDSTSVYIRATLSDTSAGEYRVFLVLSHLATVSASPSLYEAGTFVNTYFRKGIDSTDIRVLPATLSSAGFAPGDTVFAAAYVANAGGINSGYSDTLTGKTVYTNIDTTSSDVIKFVAP